MNKGKAEALMDEAKRLGCFDVYLAAWDSRYGKVYAVFVSVMGRDGHPVLSPHLGSLTSLRQFVKLNAASREVVS